MLMQLPKIIESSDLKQLRQLLDKTESAVRSLQGIGISIDTYGTFLIPGDYGENPARIEFNSESQHG